MVAESKAKDQQVEIRAQAGSQEAFLASSADIVVYGGAAGAGKTYALLMEPIRHLAVEGFGAVIFRRTYPQITNEGGMWDTAQKLYPMVGGSQRESKLEWVFPSRVRIKFAHMQYEQDRYQWDGAQIAFIGFDQLEHFTWRQFTYMLSRNRSVCGVPPYIRATCNPDPDHWLRSFMSWWIDDESGLPILERSGVIRWFIVRNDEVYWAGTPEELKALYGDDALPKSFTFIPGTIEDNQILLETNPEYLANLEAMRTVDRERLRRGNWNIRDTAGTFFKREWFEIVPAVPAGIESIRYWDRAASVPQNGKPARGSWTAGLLLGKDAAGVFYIQDVVRFQGSPMTVEKTIRNTATQDGASVQVGIEQDPGQAGKAEAQAQVRNLAGFIARVNIAREAKGMRAKPVSAQAEAGNIKIVRGPWNDAALRELDNFDGTDNCMNDQVDALSGAFHMLTKPRIVAGAWGPEYQKVGQ